MITDKVLVLWVFDSYERTGFKSLLLRSKYLNPLLHGACGNSCSSLYFKHCYCLGKLTHHDTFSWYFFQHKMWYIHYTWIRFYGIISHKIKLISNSLFWMNNWREIPCSGWSLQEKKQTPNVISIHPSTSTFMSVLFICFSVENFDMVSISTLSE